METFSDRLNWSIERSGLGRPEFASNAGVGTSALAKWLGGKMMPKSEQLLGLARAAGVSMEWLISGIGNPAGGIPYAQMLAVFKKVGETYHPGDIEAQESLSDVLSDAVGPVIINMSERKDRVISDNPEKKTPRNHESRDDRRVPMLGWAHAGHAASYEELPHEWQETIPTDCRDPKAFGVTLEGDSMEPYFREGDQLVLMPGEEAHSGCYAVCRFADDGVLFRRIEWIGERIQLVPLNPRYQPTHHNRSEFSWIYPVWGRWSQLWKR